MLSMNWSCLKLYDDDGGDDDDDDDKQQSFVQIALSDSSGHPTQLLVKTRISGT